MESTEAFRVVEQSVQKPVADSSASAYIPSKPPASTPPLWEGKKRGDPLGEPVAFPQGLPAGAEEQRQFLTEQCISSFCLCLSRFPQHYKSLYRLAFLYTYSKTHRVRRPWRGMLGMVMAASCRQVCWKADGQNQTDWNFGVRAGDGRDGKKSCRGRASPKCGPAFPGLTSWVQLADASLKPLLPRCWVLTVSLAL